MTLRSGIYRIRNYRTRNHAVLPRESGDIVACNDCPSSGEKWRVEWRNDNNKYCIQNHDKPDYYAIAEHRLIPNGDTYLRGLAVTRPQLWEVNSDRLGQSIEDTTETFTIFSGTGDGGYWKFKTGEPNAHVILTQKSPNDWSLWIFEWVGVDERDLSKVTGHKNVGAVPEDNGRYDEGEKEIQHYFEKIPWVRGAAYNSSQREFKLGCLDGTRGMLLSTVHEWVQKPKPSLFWLNGLAGTGKTTVAHTIAEYYESRKQLGGCFFFSRDQQDRRKTEFLFTTIAYQLGLAYPEVKRNLATTIKHSNVLDSNSQTQLQKLILEPVRSAFRRFSSPIVIVLDALDESDSTIAVSNVVESLAIELHHTALPLKFFVTSRPEMDLRFRFSSVSSETQMLVLHDIDAKVVQLDIKLFLRVNLAEIARKYGSLIPQDWPTAGEIDALTERAGGLFIFASTVVEFLGGSSYRAPERLMNILDTRTSTPSSNNPYTCLDKLYHQILVDALDAGPDPPGDARPLFRLVVGSVMLMFERMSCDELSLVLNIPVTHIRGALAHLHSIIKVPEGSGKIQAFHPSLHDYLTDKTRCTEDRLCIIPSSQHHMISKACLRVMMKSLEESLHRIIDEGEPLENFKVPTWLLYCCRYWKTHVRMCILDDELRREIEIFLSKSSPHWIIALTITYDLPGTMPYIERAMELGLTWSPIFSDRLWYFANALNDRQSKIKLLRQKREFQRMSGRCYVMAAVLSVGLTPTHSAPGLQISTINMLSPLIRNYSAYMAAGSDYWDLDEARQWLMVAIARVPTGSLVRAAYQHILASVHLFDGSLNYQYSLSILNALIDEMPDHVGVQQDLTAMLCDLFSLDCNPHDVCSQSAETVGTYIQHFYDTPMAGDIEPVDRVRALGGLYRIYSEMLYDVEDASDHAASADAIDKSIGFVQQEVAYANTMEGNSEMLYAILNLGRCYCMRYQLFRISRDVDEVMRSLSEAISYLPGNSKNPECRYDHRFEKAIEHMEYVGTTLHKSFERHGHLEDLDASTLCLLKAAEGVVNWDTSQDTEGIKSYVCDSLMDSLRARFHLTGKRGEFEEGIRLVVKLHNPNSGDEVQVQAFRKLVSELSGPYVSVGDNTEEMNEEIEGLV